jgi:hypothetical protein
VPHETPRFNLTTFDAPSDTLAHKGYKFSDADRAFLDSLLAYVVERHVHTGVAPGLAETRPDAANLSLSATGGILPPNTPIYYQYGVVDNLGQEHLASKIASAYTTPTVTAPIPPTLSPVSGGTLNPGTYLYAISAYAPDSNRETLLSSSVAHSLVGVGSIQVDFPTPPSGAYGFNLYRKAYTDTHFQWLARVSAQPFTAPPYIDDGTVASDPLRAAPTTNTSSNSNSITVSVPTTLPAGHTWRVYRTFDSANWDNTLLAWNGGEPVVDTGYMGDAAGSPRGASAAVGSPPKIDLSTETTGNLPARQISTIEVVRFNFLGGVTVGIPNWQWVNDFPLARVIALQVNLARGSTPAVQPIIIGLQRLVAPSPTWQAYTETATIPVGGTVGPRVPMGAASQAIILKPKDALRVNTIQAGGGATPTDLNMVVNVIIAVTTK